MEQKNTKWSAVVFYNLAWLIASIMMIVDLLSIREASLDVMTVIQANQIAASQEGEKNQTKLDTGLTIGFIDQSLLFGGGIVSMAMAIAIEYYFRKGQQKGRLLKRIILVMGTQIAVFLVCVGIQTFV